MRDELNRLAKEVASLHTGSDYARGHATSIAKQLRALSARAAVPEGWALVPVKPTKFMMDAAIPPGRQDQTGRREFAIWQAMLAAAPQPAGEDEKEYEYLQSLADDPLLDGWAPEPHRATKKSTEPAPSAPSPGDALSLHGAAGRSASRAPADVEALAMRMYGKWTDNQGIHCNRFPSWSELSEANRGEWMKKAQQAAKGGAE